MTTKVNGTVETRLTEREFIVQAIRNLRKPPYKGIHVVYSGFNQAFRSYFGSEPRAFVDSLVSEGTVVVKIVKGGAMMYLASDAPAIVNGEDVLSKIIGRV